MFILECEIIFNLNDTFEAMVYVVWLYMLYMWFMQFKWKEVLNGNQWNILS